MAMLQAQLQQAQHSDTVWEMSAARPLIMYHSPETRLYTNVYYRDPLLTLIIIVRQKYIIKKRRPCLFLVTLVLFWIPNWDSFSISYAVPWHKHVHV